MPLRPTPDAMRERAFAVLADRVNDARFLDLYAGTGAVGLEALSRGARLAVFVENHRAAARLVRANCSSLALDESCARLIVRPALKAVQELAAHGDSFDLAWADPPFESWREGLDALIAAFASGLLAQDALACLECPAKADVKGSLPSEVDISRDLVGGASRVVMVSMTRT
jgi:16S rRNA (guanine966-N2)-methyltransferase